MSGLLETRTALSKIREVAHGVFHEKQPCSSLMIPPYKWWGIPKSSGPTAPPLPTSGCEFESLASNGRVAPVYICTPPSWSPRSGTLSLQPKIISRLFALDGIECSLSSEYLAVNRQLAAGALAIVAMGDTDGERVAMELATTEGKHAVFIEADGVAEVDGHMDDVSRVRLPWCENGKEESIREVRATRPYISLHQSDMIHSSQSESSLSTPFDNPLKTFAKDLSIVSIFEFKKGATAY